MRSWSGYLPPMAAAVVTLLVTWLYAAINGAEEVATPVLGALFVILMPVPLVVSVLWGAGLLVSRPHRLILAGALGWLALSLALAPAGVVWQLAGHVGAGLAAGLMLGLRARLDLTLALVTAALLPMVVWSALQFPVQDQVDAATGELTAMMRQQVPEGATDDQRAKAEQQLRKAVQDVGRITVRIYPGLLALGLLGQACVTLLLVWLVARRLGIEGLGRRLGPFTEWRMPFYLVWITIAGVGLLLTRIAPLDTAGLNILIVAGTLVSVQGLAIQVFVTNRMLSPVMRLLFWVVMGVFLTLILMLSCLVLGLVDQWLDVRRLQHRNEPREGE